MREKLDGVADKLFEVMAVDLLCYNALRSACGKESVLSIEEYKWIGDALDLVGKDDGLPFSIWESIVIIFGACISIPWLKILCKYQRHKLDKLIEAEEA